MPRTNNHWRGPIPTTVKGTCTRHAGARPAPMDIPRGSRLRREELLRREKLAGEERLRRRQTEIRSTMISRALAVSAERGHCNSILENNLLPELRAKETHSLQQEAHEMCLEWEDIAKNRLRRGGYSAETKRRRFHPTPPIEFPLPDVCGFISLHNNAIASADFTAADFNCLVIGPDEGNTEADNTQSASAKESSADGAGIAAAPTPNREPAAKETAGWQLRSLEQGISERCSVCRRWRFRETRQIGENWYSFREVPRSRETNKVNHALQERSRNNTCSIIAVSRSRRHRCPNRGEGCATRNV